MKKSIWALLDFYRAWHALGIRNAIQLMVKSKFGRGTYQLPLRAPLKREIKLRGQTSDWWVFHQIFVCKEYPLFRNFTPHTIIDAGANIGITNLFYRKHYPEAEIVSLEIEPDNLKLLKYNLSGDSKTEILQNALWSRSTQLEITNPTAAKYSFQVRESLKGNIQGISVPEILEHKGWDSVDLLKIDIEGSEYTLFKEGAEAWLNKVGIIVIEMHERYQPGCSKHLFDALSSIDYYFKVKANNLIIVNKRIADCHAPSGLFRELFS